jgi:SAM-dependent methyltransferase
MNCRFCGTLLRHEFIDLGNAPPSNSFLTPEQLTEPEIFYPLKLFVCDKCFLIQIHEYKKSKEIFSNEYPYYSSFSKSWLKHARNYMTMITERLQLTSKSLVIEIASNDGYLLQYFKEKSIPCLGIEPAGSTAAVARDKGIPVISEFFGARLAKQLADQDKKADLIIGNNVLAHVPDINDFVAGLKMVLKKEGVITLEFPHLMRLVEEKQFDTIYHEHYSYLSFYTVKQIFRENRLTLFDVEELSTHGGSLRIYARHAEKDNKPVADSVRILLDAEKTRGIKNIEFYQHFQSQADTVKYELLLFLITQKRSGKKVIAYGAAAKGNTLLNYCGVREDLISFVVDASPYKQGKFLPGSHIPVVSELLIRETQPDFILILPWNIKDEVMKQLEYVGTWGARFIVPIPKLTVI